MKVFMTGAGGNMGFESFKAMSADIGKNYDLIVLLRDSEKNHRLFDPYKDMKGLTVIYGDLLNKEDVAECIRRSDMCLHIAAYVSPWADYHPEKAMQNNYGSTKNLIDAIVDQGKADTYKFVYIGTVAETGDRSKYRWYHDQRKLRPAGHTAGAVTVFRGIQRQCLQDVCRAGGLQRDARVF